jgi:ubiquinone/menaquinone biosynthesis C-methylase UbiE
MGTTMKDQLQRLHEKIYKLLAEERVENPKTYHEDIPYQGYDRIQFKGIRWTPEKRIKEYGIDKYVRPGMTVLDIGCNSGFVSVEVAYSLQVAKIVGVEPNRWLCQVGQLVADYLGVGERTQFIESLFNEMKMTSDFDVVMSLACFFPQCGKESEAAQEYFGRCHKLLKEDGTLIFESCSYENSETSINYAKAKEAMNVLPQFFQHLESKTTPSGSPGWFRDYFIGRRLNLQ